jgi:hypothetical protein
LWSVPNRLVGTVYPQNIGLLDYKGILPVGGEFLFGPKFVDAVMDQVNTLNKLDQAGKSAAPPPNQPKPSTSSGSNAQNLYVQTSLAFSDSFGAVLRDSHRNGLNLRKILGSYRQCVEVLNWSSYQPRFSLMLRPMP